MCHAHLARFSEASRDEAYRRDYLLGHGVLKLWLIVSLLRERLWYCPISMVVFGLFIAYQLYRYTFTYSIWLLLITALDIVILGLTWHEYRFLRNRRKTIMSDS